MAVRYAVFVDPLIAHKHFKNIGRAYREQAITLIEICYLYQQTHPRTYTESDAFQKSDPSERFLREFAVLITL